MCVNGRKRIEIKTEVVGEDEDNSTPAPFIRLSSGKERCINIGDSKLRKFAVKINDLKMDQRNLTIISSKKLKIFKRNLKNF